MPTDDLVQRLRRRLEARAEILDAYLFGSWARGERAPHSDVDVAVFVDPAHVPASPFGYRAELAAELMTATGRDALDVVVLNHASPLLYQRVLRDGQRLVSRDLAATTTREGQALSRYCDYAHQLRTIDGIHAARLGRGSFGK